MILTCPACATQYTVKDGAIPPGGRQVRCASCKHSWHQDPPAEDGFASAEDIAGEAAIGGGPPQPASTEQNAWTGEPSQQATDDQTIAETPEPDVGQADDASPQETETSAPVDDRYATADQPIYAPEFEGPGDGTFNETATPEVGYAADDDFAIPEMHDVEDARGGALKWLAGLVLLVVLAAVAFWFLAPASYKERVGLAQGGDTPLELMLTTSDRQKLASGNELLAISGRIINPTDREQIVPPIAAQLRNKASKAIIYSWTIAPPMRTIPARGTANFNSAEVDIPEGGDELTVTLGGVPS